MVQCPGCCPTCGTSRPTQTWCHLSCLSILAWSYPVGDNPRRDDLLSFANCTRPRWRNWQVPFHHVNHSFDRPLVAQFTTLLLGSIFSDELVKRLPDDIVSEIMEKLDPIYLSNVRESRLLIETIPGASPRTKIPLDFSGALYASTLSFGGHSYISNISRRPKQRANARKLGERPETAGYRIVVSLDEIGVRDIRIFDREVSTIPSDGSPWYHIINVKSPSKALFQGMRDVSRPTITC